MILWEVGCWLAGINHLNMFQCVLRNKPNRQVVILVPFKKDSL